VVVGTPQAAFEERLGEVVRERLMADSKSTAFFLECEALAHKVGSSRKVYKEMSSIFADQ
jgi:hypothetical protein